MSSDSRHVLPINQLQPNPFQPRAQFTKDELEDMVSSIKMYGVLEPLVIAETPAGFQIIAGERRWRAAKAAGLTEVPVVIKKTTPRGMLEMAIVENLQRSDLDPLERAKAFQQLEREFKLSSVEIAQKVGKSVPYVSNTLRLLQLPDAIKDGLLGGLITEGHARALGAIENERTMIECYKVILKRNLSVRHSEELVRRFRERDQAEFSDRGRPQPLNEEFAKKLESRVQNMFKSKTQFRLTRSTRQTKIYIFMKGGIEETQADLDKLVQLLDEKNAE